MALQKQAANVSFGQGVDTKTDPNQLPAGKMLSLQNVVFNVSGQLTKRNGFKNLVTLDADVSSLSTLNNNLLATGKDLYALSPSTNTWTNQGLVEAIELNTHSLIRTDASQVFSDLAISDAGVVCTTYQDSTGSYFQVSDKTTSQILVNAVRLPTSSVQPKVFLLNEWFVVVFNWVDTGVAKMSFITVPHVSPTNYGSITTLTTLIDSVDAIYDGTVINETLYIGFNASDVGGGTRIIRMNSSLIVSTSQLVVGRNSDLISITVDPIGSTPTVYIAYYEDATGTAAYRRYNLGLLPLLADTIIYTGVDTNQLTVVAKNGTGKLFYEVVNQYTYAAVDTHYLASRTINSIGTIGTQVIFVRSVGLASEAFMIGDKYYMLATYAGVLQPSYFLVDENGNVISRLAYSNGNGYNLYLPNVVVNGLEASIPFLRKTQVRAVNKAQAATNVAGIYSQVGVDIAMFEFEPQQFNAEAALSQHFTGGQLWQFDGVKPVENNFHVWPDEIAAVASTDTGTLAPQQYYYQFTYEWTDSQGVLQKSAPSIPVGVLLAGPDNTITINVPTLRLTAKTGNNKVQIVGYRWSTAQQNYYQFTSITTPTLNDTTTDSVTIIDTLPDADIIGNTLVYTTGGVVENIGAPANAGLTLYKSRLFLIDSEDKNLLWFSKQILETTPVEMSDAFTIYIPPSGPAQGVITALSAMDDKLIIFKKNAIFYLVGIGPDNTGAQNDFTDPVLITSTVGCTNAKSIVYTPNGLMFQSEKGMWILNRDLSTQYIGSDVEAYNDIPVTSAVTIPGTNEVRFTIDNRTCLMYDYYYQQWGVFTNVPAISSTVYGGFHTYIDNLGFIRQESPNSYLDGTVPVLVQFTTAWFKLTQLQGFQRAYFFYMLGNFLTPHKLQVDIAYDYNPSPTQTTLISPTNYSPAWGGDIVWGAGERWGGSDNVEQWRVFLQKQKCQAIQISMQEIADTTIIAVAGAGLTISGLNFVIGAKKGFPVLPSSQSVG